MKPSIQKPMSAQPISPTEALIQTIEKVTTPHPSITDLRVKKQVQLLNGVAILVFLSSLAGLLAGPQIVQVFQIMLAISLGSYLLGKSKTPQAGALLFSFGFVSITYLSFYFGYATNYPSLVLSITPITLIAASALLEQKVFAGLITYAISVTFLAPLYFSASIRSNETMQAGGIIAAISGVLYGINIFRSRLEKSEAEDGLEANEQLREIKLRLENQVESNAQQIHSTREEIKRLAEQLRVTDEISLSISNNIYLPLEELLTSIAEKVSDKMGFYHVGIFLLDKRREYAELRASNSEGGQRMLERRHQLKVGGTGIVGYVAQSGFPRTALSTGADAVFFNNPDLPKTRSEMALPLKAGNLVIGVLDVQSELPAAFSDEDIHVFNTLANQIALAVQNIQALENPSAQRINKKKAAERLTSKEKKKGYAYFSDGTIAAAQEIRNPALEKALKSSESVAMPATTQNEMPILAVPVKIRGNIVGYINIEAADSRRKWTEDEIIIVEAVSERAALALENARLFEESERRAEQEQIMTQVTSRIGEANSFDRILQTTIQEIGRTLKARRAYIQIEPIDSEDDHAAEQGI